VEKDMKCVESVYVETNKSSHCGRVIKNESEVSHCGKVMKESSHCGKVINESESSHCGKVKKENEGSHCGKVRIIGGSSSGSVEKVKSRKVGVKSKLRSVCQCGRKFKIEGSISNQENMIKLSEHVRASGQFNFQCCQIPVPASKNFNMVLWRERLRDYEDKVLCDLLEFGFPLDFDKNKEVSYNERRNHKGAREFPDFINRYLKKECENYRIVGPFVQNPLSTQIVVSPLNSVPKSSPDERRVIVDLSWPHGLSVNDGISKETYLGEQIELHYASVEEVCRTVRRLGPGSVIYKRDLRHAYRQFPVDPGDYCFLAYYWEHQYYLDTVLAMGQRNAGMSCSRVTKSIMYMHAEDGYEGSSYLDDLIGVSSPQLGQEAYESLGELLAELGLLENLAKACPPNTIQLVLGVLINTVDGTISVPGERLDEINALLTQWRRKRKTTKDELQSLIGKLQFVTKCVRQSRIFINRMLEMLRSFSPDAKSKVLSESFQKDITWWWCFMERFNSVSYIPVEMWSEPDVSFSTDSCLTGCGGICETEYFHASYPESILERELPIHDLEMLAVLIAVRFWGQYCSGGKIQIYCDNEAVVRVINSSRTRDPYLGACLRELWLEVSRFGFELRAIHLLGVDNRVADWLSRWDINPEYRNSFNNFVGDDVDKYKELNVNVEMFELSGDL
jgi:hypothetical protein